MPESVTIPIFVSALNARSRVRRTETRRCIARSGSSFSTWRSCWSMRVPTSTSAMLQASHVPSLSLSCTCSCNCTSWSCSVVMTPLHSLPYGGDCGRTAAGGVPARQWCLCGSADQQRKHASPSRHQLQYIFIFLFRELIHLGMFA